jgi:branched-chain amino acid aminotransferase
MISQIHIQKCVNSRANDLDFDNIPLGKTFTDHMFLCSYESGQWQSPKIVPLAAIPTHPAAMAFHYGQAIFEGMKATVDSNGTPILFRPEANAKRLNFSARRLGMPEFPESLFVEALETLVSLDRQWIPSQQGSALYLRPFMYADEAFIGMRAATRYKFIVMASPSNPIYKKRIRLYAETNYIRAAQGGTGEAKAAGNYAAAILPTEAAKAKGYDQVLWLDAQNFKAIQEVGTMNIFFKINGTIITPALDGAILAGITRMSAIELLRYKGFEVVERRLTIDEVIEASAKGHLEEAFGTGTAVGVAMIQDIGYESQIIHISNNNPVGQMVLETLNGIRTGKIPDDFNWMYSVEV